MGSRHWPCGCLNAPPISIITTAPRCAPAWCLVRLAHVWCALPWTETRAPRGRERELTPPRQLGHNNPANYISALWRKKSIHVKVYIRVLWCARRKLFLFCTMCSSLSALCRCILPLRAVWISSWCEAAKPPTHPPSLAKVHAPATHILLSATRLPRSVHLNVYVSGHLMLRQTFVYSPRHQEYNYAIWGRGTHSSDFWKLDSISVAPVILSIATF